MSGDDPWDFGFSETGVAFKSAAQSARVWTEEWVGRWCYCPNCGSPNLEPFGANRPVADFGCRDCPEEYELKSTKGRFGPKVVDGAYGTMMRRLAASNNPNLILLGYDAATLRVTDLTVVPKQFFTPEVIEQRKPLADTARRAGWVGCNILLGKIPRAGQLPIVRSGLRTDKAAVLEQWRSTLFIRERPLASRTWLAEVMKCVEAIGKAEFTLAEVYAHEGELRMAYPRNQNVRPKIRQQLQVLRDAGYLQFLAPGVYKRAA